MKTKRKIKKHNFSLLEVVIAITIVALIAALAVPAVMDDAEEAKKQAAIVEMNTLKGVIIKYKLATGKFPSTLDDLVTNTTGAANWKQYLETVPKDPWKTSYHFELRPEIFNKFEIISYGADGQPGGEGINSDITLSKAKE